MQRWALVLCDVPACRQVKQKERGDDTLHGASVNEREEAPNMAILGLVGQRVCAAHLSCVILRAFSKLVP